MEAGNRCFDECLPEETNRRIVDIISDVNMCYSEHARRYLNASGVAKERTYVTGSPMAEVLHKNLDSIEASDIHVRLNLRKGNYILLSAHREENIDTEKNFLSLFRAINAMAAKYDMPILYSCHPRSRKRLEASGFPVGQPCNPSRTFGLPRLQLLADECLRGGQRQRYPAGGEFLLPVCGPSFPCCMYPYKHGASRGIGQRLLRAGRYRREVLVAGRWIRR